MINIEIIQKTAESLMAKAAIEIPDDYLTGLQKAANDEDGDLSSFVLEAMSVMRKTAEIFWPVLRHLPSNGQWSPCRAMKRLCGYLWKILAKLHRRVFKHQMGACPMQVRL